MENFYFGRHTHFAKKYQKNFVAKKATEYSLDEWMENIYIASSENTSIPDYIYFMDRRIGTNHTLEYKRIEVDRIKIMENSEEEAKKCIQAYWLSKNKRR